MSTVNMNARRANGAKTAAVAIVTFALASCGARNDELGTVRNGDQGTPSPTNKGAKVTTNRAANNAKSTASDPTADATPDSTRSSAATTDDPTAELAQRKAVNPEDSDLPLPLCSAPLHADFGYPTFGTEAVRLHWRPETGECKFTSGDGTPEGWAGIVSLRHHDDDLFLSGIGEWQYYAPKSLDLDALPEDETLTFYPYLGDWQFVIDVRYEGSAVTIERFQYIDGEPPADFGVPNETSNDPVDGPMLVPCASLHEDDGEEEGQP